MPDMAKLLYADEIYSHLTLATGVYLCLVVAGLGLSLQENDYKYYAIYK